MYFKYLNATKKSAKNITSGDPLCTLHIVLAGVGRVELPITESKSVALPLGDTPILWEKIVF